MEMITTKSKASVMITEKELADIGASIEDFVGLLGDVFEKIDESVNEGMDDDDDSVHTAAELFIDGTKKPYEYMIFRDKILIEGSITHICMLTVTLAGIIEGYGKMGEGG